MRKWNKWPFYIISHTKLHSSNHLCSTATQPVLREHHQLLESWAWQVIWHTALPWRGRNFYPCAFINKRKRKDKRNTGNGKTSGKYCQVERKKLKSPAFCDSLITTVHMFLGVTTALFMFLSPQLKLYWIYEFSLYHDKKNISITTRETPWTRFFPN